MNKNRLTKSEISFLAITALLVAWVGFCTFSAWPKVAERTAEVREVQVLENYDNSNPDDISDTAEENRLLLQRKGV